MVLGGFVLNFRIKYLRHDSNKRLIIVNKIKL